MRVGIENIRVYPSSMALDMRTLVEARGGDVTEVCGEMMIDARSVNPAWEDPITMGVNAARMLLTDEDREQVGLLLVGSESGPDQEKSLSTWIQRYAGLEDHCRNMEVKHACYAGTGAVHLAAHWLLAQPDDVKALVVTTDQSRAHFHKPYEFVMGAGAVAMLLSKNPQFLELELGLGGVFTHEVSDLTRPTSRVEAGHSETSLLSYLDAADLTFERYAEAVRARHGESLLSWEAYRAWLPYQVYHAPFGGITKRAHRAIHRLFEDFDAARTRRDFEARVVPTLKYNRLMGGTYASSVFVSLLGTASAFGPEVAGSRVGIYSYGSGSCAEFYSGVFGAQASEVAREAGLDELLAARRPLTVREYEDAERERSAFIDCGDYRTSKDGHDGWYDERYAGRESLVFDGIRDFERQYAWS